MDPMPDEILKRIEPQLPEPPAMRQKPAGLADHWSQAVLLERAAYLRKLARHGDGVASETLKEYAQHTAILLFRSRSGEAEVHEEFADLFFVLEGRATLVTGGVLTAAKTIAPGEMRGEAIDGGASQQLRPGDVAHVLAGLPHQMLVEGDKTLTCLVIKVRENLVREIPQGGARR